MSLGLPESFFHVCAVSFTSLNAKLIERSENADCSDFSSCFPESFDRCMEILSNRIRTCVPEADLFGQAVGERVVGEWKGGIEEAEQVAEVN